MKQFIKILRVTLKALIILVGVIVVVIAGFLIYATATDYAPAAIENASVNKVAGHKVVLADEVSFLSWNIGYCSLGKEMDFFYDGGSQVRATEENYQTYLNGVFNFLARYDSVDFILVQEVDQDARRSYSTDQTQILRESLAGHNSAFALNYDVDFVPLPIYNPMGKVNSGLMSFSRYAPVSSQRYAFLLNYDWPMNVFMLDRCFLLQRIKVSGGKELVIINTHNSPYGDSEMLRKYELWTLRSIMLSEYEKGNYVVAGGDWNQCPAGFSKIKFEGKYNKVKDMSEIEEGFFPEDWSIVYDPKIPTNRDVVSAYQPGVTPTSIIDFFIVSPNLEVEEVRTIPTGFAFSDHMPVYCKARLISNPLELCPDVCTETIQLLLDSIATLHKPKGGGGENTPKEETKQDRFIQRK
jgi:endonuclease/exonuclease/phosphatase family metal-dependent hydrolase